MHNMCEHASTTGVNFHIRMMGKMKQTKAKHFGDQDVFDFRIRRMEIRRRTPLYSSKKNASCFMHRGEASLAEVVGVLCCDNVRHGNRYGDFWDEVRRNPSGKVLFTCGIGIYLFACGVGKGVAIGRADVHLQLDSLVEVNRVELNIVFLQYAAVIIGWFTRCVAQLLLDIFAD